jgi:uroporphyrinogen-III decarboxylase
MTSRERVLLAMNFEYPDRVPVMCQMSIGHMLQQLKDVSPVEFWFDAETFANGLIYLRELYQFDGILVSLHGHFKNWREIYNQREVQSDKEIVYLNDRKLIFTNEDLPFPEFFDERKYPSIDEIDISTLPAEIDYIPVSGGLHFKIDLNNKFEVFDLIYQKVGDEFSIHGEVTSPFDYLLDLLGYENALMSLIENPEKCKQILQHFTNGISTLASEMCDKQIDAIKISSPFAGAGFISPEFYKEFVLPYESQIISAIKSKGKFAYLHTCGAINDRLELMIESGTSGLECLDPRPLGDVDLADAKRRLGFKVFIKGNIDSVNTLLFGSPKSVIVDVIDIISIGKTNGGFILSTACSIAPKVPAENVKLLKDLAEKFGRY